MTRTITVGTRGSKLALAQAWAVIRALKQIDPARDIQLREINSAGDQQPNAPIESLGVGVFTSAIEQVLSEGGIDLAVHSLKDLPTEQPPGLLVIPVLQREDARDVLINKWGVSLLDLPESACIGTSSPRRAAQLRHGRSDVLFAPIRGNIETRITKSEGPDYDGVVLAAAGVHRLSLSRQVAEYLSPHICTPAPGQAVLAAELRKEDLEIIELVQQLIHRPTAIASEAERWVLRAAGSGCQLPLGAFAEIEGHSMRLFATATPLDGSTSYRVEITGSADEPEILGRAAFEALLQQGAASILESTN